MTKDDLNSLLHESVKNLDFLKNKKEMYENCILLNKMIENFKIQIHIFIF